MRIVYTILLIGLSIGAIQAQNKDSLLSIKAEKAAELAALQGEIDAIDATIASIPGWRVVASGP